MADLTNGNLPDVLPEDVGYRCRVLDIDDSIVANFTDQDGEHYGAVIVPFAEPSNLQGLLLVLEAMCHAINAGTPQFDILAAMSALHNFAKMPFPIEGWKPCGLEKTMRVRYVFRHEGTGECLIVSPDEKTTRVGKRKTTP